MTRFAHLAVAAIAALPLAAAAQVVKIIVPTPPGGGTDGFFRVVGKEAEPFLKQSVIVENVPGAGGTIGVGKMVTSKPDGLTVAGIWSSPLTATPHTLKATPYTPNDYIPVIELSHTPYVMCVDPKFPANSGPELVAELKKAPDKYTFGNDGIGGTGQLSAARVFKALGLKVRDVPFKGAGETLTSFMGGHVDIYVGSPAPILPHVANGKSKCLIVTSAERLPALPNASGLKDLGIPGEETMLWRAILVPKATPTDVVRKLESAFEQAMTTPATKAYVEKAGEIVQIRKGAELRKMLDAEYASLAAVAKGLNLQPQ
jgi:tripartite-type tricarboxylate transporter receptor subunit TctC